MNIALITNNFLPKTGGITNVMVNVSGKLKKLGENVYIFNKTYEDTENLCFKVLSNATTLKGIFIHHVKFYFFLFYLFFKILLSFRNLKFKDRFRLVSFYCVFPKFIVRRIISIKNLILQFKKQKIDIILSGTADISLLYSF